MRIECFDEGISSCTLLERRRGWERLDGLPFAMAYVALASLYASGWLPQAATRLPEEIVTLLWYAAAVALVAVHGCAMLAAFWSVAVRAKLRYKPAETATATFVCVMTNAHCGNPDICALKRLDKAPAPGGAEAAEVDVRLPAFWFEFQREKFGWTGSADEPVRKFDCPTRLALGKYLAWRGHGTQLDLTRATGKWGKNEFDIPFPSMQELFTEHALAPFFIFQVLCVALWCLDEYWYYSVFTLIMLVLFELTVCKQRQQSLGTLRNMRRPAFPVFVFRGAKWYRILTSELVPGDICSVLRVTKASAAGVMGGDDDELLMPCDVLLLRGSCIVNEAMLTGESVPKMKESVQAAVHGNPSLSASALDMHDDAFAQHVVLGGTRVIQHATAGRGADGEIPEPPDQGCICFVLRTGFATSQGSLMRTILFSTERVTVDNAESYLFIGVLLVFAVFASVYVMIEGLKNEKQSRWKLFLHCTMIVTSVVPPELPMELSLAVNTSLARLHKLAIFCTEPYRIPLAGRLDICCFDKTGTLTSDRYIVKGVATDLARPHELTEPDQLSPEATFVIAGCHQLVRLSNKVDGDPMEQAAVRSIKWGMTRDGRMIRRNAAAGARKEQLRIVHRHPFSSTLKRMSAFVFVDDLRKDAALGSVAAHPTALYLTCKGAPEVLEPHLAAVPAHYRQAYQSLMMRGARVLALAYKELPVKTSMSEIERMERHDAEAGLTFCGFLALDCPLKDDTAGAIRQLQHAQHEIVIITGDNALTACDVARQLGIVPSNYENVLALEASSVAAQSPCWACIDPARPLPNPISYTAGSTEALRRAGKTLVVTGAALDAIEARSSPRASADPQEAFVRELAHLAPQVTVFARVSPRHKELVLAAIKSRGLHCLMCGDGTNDVGALKQADIGVSIINSPEHEEAVRKARSELGKTVPETVLNSLSASERLRAELQTMEAAQQGSSIVQLGDASIASPFTSKTTSILSTVHIVRQGRCTLVTTIQMYKILALNCLISAYSLSALHLYGVKQGDTQATLAGLLIAGLFMFISWAEPLEELSAERPVARLFCVPVMVSLAGQLVVHFAALLGVLTITQPLVDEAAEEMQPDAAFKPNLINSAVFLVALCIQCNIFGANYRGAPFMQSLRDNKAFHRVLGSTWVLCIAMAADVVPGLGDQFELVAIPTDGGYRDKLLAILAADTAASWAWEAFARRATGA